MAQHAEKDQDDNVLPLVSKPTASVVFVTPDMAKRWLKLNTHNRKVRDADVRRYARDMASGDWSLTGEAVKFDAAGTLLDGQHRLAAIVLSGATVPLFVIRGVDSEAQAHMDTGRKRTASDVLSLSGETHSSLLAATARLALGVNLGGSNIGRYEASHAEITEFVNDNPGLRYAVDFIRQYARRTDCPPAIAAYAFWRMARIDTMEAGQFWMAAADKIGLRQGDPTIALTNRLAEARRNRQRLSKEAYLSLIFRAWNARRAGKSLSLLRVNSSAGGIVPIPDLR
jgi:hypothetical protein